MSEPRRQQEHAPCPDKGCGARFGHSLVCRLASVEERAEQRDVAVQGWHTCIAKAERLLHQVTFWQGKHAILRLENNKLRRKVHALKENIEALLIADELRQAMKEPVSLIEVKEES